MSPATSSPRPTASPKQGQVRAALAARLTARRSAVEAATSAQRQLLTLVVTCPPALHDRLAKLRTRQLIVSCEWLRSHPSHDIETPETITVLPAFRTSRTGFGGIYVSGL